ncbi:MAG: HNH endonuclease [Candidatus Saccharimonadales bacterium]
MDYYKNLSKNDLPGEEWRKMEDFWGYEISSYGRVRSYRIKGLKVRYSGLVLDKDYHLLSQSLVLGYPHLSISKYPQEKKMSVIVHRVTASVFIPNPLDKPTVNHINGDTTDGRIENLEWATQAENNKHAYDTGLRIPKYGNENPVYGRRDYECPQSRQVVQMDLNNQEIKIWPSATTVQRELNIWASNISACCRNIVNTAGGYKWKFSDVPNKSNP